MKKPELLAPVGGKAHLTAAVNAGADAVYMGGMAFNARIFADNFSDEELPDAINYAHAHGVKVYMTINTLIKDSELVRAFEYCNYIYGLGVDALIIQDMGLVRLLRKYLPDFPLHLSTQGTLYNEHALSLVERLGFRRVVPARELSIDEIKKLSEACAQLSNPIETEVFVHGALCMCYSGQCQMSRIMGAGSGRTGNRGTCAQPCRLAYTDENGRSYYALSPKDLCRIENIPELVEAGVASFKIEGRMKRPEYVAVVTSIYRKYIDLYERLVHQYGADEAASHYRVEERDMLTLRQIFNRGDFTEGYLRGNPGDDLLSGASPKNQGLYFGRAVAVLDNEYKVNAKDERAAVKGALRRGRNVICIESDRRSAAQGITIKQNDGVEFRREDADYLVGSPVNSVVTYNKDIGDGIQLIGDFERGVEPGDLVYKVTDREMIESALDVPERKIPVSMIFTARMGQFANLVMTDIKANRSIEINADHIVESAKTTPTDADRIESNLRRLGDTPFDPGLTGIDVQIDDDIMMPLSIVNRMRRDAADELLRLRLEEVTAARSHKLSRAELDVAEAKEMLGAETLDPEMIETQIKASKKKPVSLENYMKKLDEGGEIPKETIPYILNVSKGGLDKYIEQNFDHIVEAVRGRGILIGNLGWIDRFLDAGVKVYGDYGLNVYNEQAKRLFEDIGVELYMPSHETGVADERGIPLMITEHPVGAKTLTDRKGATYRVVLNDSGDKTLIVK